MGIIANGNVENQGLVSGKKLKVGANGFVCKLFTGRGLPPHLHGARRGKIRGLSAGAVRRLRETLFEKSVEESITLGATFTVPWKVEKCSDEVICRFHSTFTKFRLRFLRRFPNSSIIYRVELQQRGAPHLHSICYIAKKDLYSFLEGERAQAAAAPVAARFALAPIAKMNIKDFWIGSLDYDSVGQFFGADKYAVKFDNLDSQNRWSLFRYLCDHASKRKQAQLGYPGRQWGVIGSQNLSSSSLEELPPFPSAHSEGVFWRLIRKLTRYRISDETKDKKWKRQPPFGSVYRGGNRKLGVIFVKGGGDAVRRCYEFAVKAS